LKLAGDLLRSRKVQRDCAVLEWQGFSSVRVPELLDVGADKPAAEPGKRKSD